MDPNRIRNIFISYSHDSEAHAAEVLALAQKLMDWGGLDVQLDQWETNPPQGWTLWMEKNIRDADFTLIICSSAYYEKVMHDTEAGTGKGVKWEGRVLRNLLFHDDSVSTRFVPVLLSNGKPVHILTVLRDATHYRANTEEGFEQLYRYLTNQPLKAKPAAKPAVRPLATQAAPPAPAASAERSVTATTPTDPQEMLRKGHLREVLDWLEDKVDKYQKDTVLLLQVRLTRLEEEDLQGVLSREDVRIERARITQAIVSLLNDIKEG